MNVINVYIAIHCFLAGTKGENPNSYSGEIKALNLRRKKRLNVIDMLKQYSKTAAMVALKNVSRYSRCALIRRK